MERVKFWLLPVYALAAFLIVIVLVPRTEWIPKVQIDVIDGTWHGPRTESDDTDPGFLAPTHLGPTASDISTEDDTLFLTELGACMAILDNKRPLIRLPAVQRFYAYCARKSTAEFWAQFARADSHDACVSDDPSFRSEDAKATLKLLVKACQAGSKLDPANGFFPAIEAGALYNLGNAEGAEQALSRASESTRFNEYTMLEPEAEYRWFLKHHGYRGNEVWIFELASENFPQYAAIKSTSQRLLQTPTPARRLIAMTLGDLMIRRGTSGISMLTGRHLVAQGLNPGKNGQPGHVKEKNGQLTELQVDGLKKDLEAAVQRKTDVERSCHDLLALGYPIIDPAYQFDNQLPSDNHFLIGAWSLLAIGAIPICLAALWAKARSEQLSAAAPFLVWLISVSAGSDPGEGHGVSPLFCLVALVGIPALFERSRSWADILGIASTVMAVTAVVLLQSFGLILPVTLFLISLLVERRGKRIPVAVTAIMAAVMLLGVAAIWVNTANIFGPTRSLLPCAFATVAAFAVIPIRRSVRWEPIIGLACLVLGVIYGTVVYRELYYDKVLGAAAKLWTNEANIIRQYHHIDPGP